MKKKLRMTEITSNISKHRCYLNETNTCSAGNITDGDLTTSGTAFSVWTPEIVTRVATVMVVMIVTLVGNVFLILLLLYKKSRRIKRVNIFIINLAIGDLAIACITMTTEIMFVAFGEWVLGPVLCKLTVYLQVVTLSSATFLLTGMSVDRFQVIVRPMQSLARRPKIWTKVVAAWTLALLFATPQLFIFVEVQTQPTNDTQAKSMCVSKGYSAKWQRKIYFTFLTLYTLILPSMIMLYCYYNIAKVVWSRAGSNRIRDPNHEGSLEQNCSPRMSVRRNLVSASKQRVVTMTLTVIIGFLVCLTPYFTISIIRVFSDYKIQLKTSLMISETIFMCHSAVNPVLYGIFTLQVDHFKALFGCWRHKHKLREDIMKQKVMSEGKCCKLRCRLSLLRAGTTYRDTSVIIANHAAKEERILIARNARKCTSVKNIRRQIHENRIRYRVEKGVQVSESVYFNVASENGVIGMKDFGTVV